MPESPRAVLCLASYEKGEEFMRECKRQGRHVILLTVTNLQHADWPRESIDEMFYMPDLSAEDDVIRAVSYLARTRAFDRVVALDEYDLQTAAALREHMRVPGMGETTARYFRDKVAMRMQARDRGILVPDFVHVLNYDRLRDYMSRVLPPWLLKPRSEASAMGIKRVGASEALWPLLDTLGDRQSFFLLERYVPGQVYHVDSIVSEREVVFSEVHRYEQPPMDVYHGGGIFMTRTVEREGTEEQSLKELNRQVIEALGMVRGVTHLEFIEGREDGRYYFLEAAARVGGANIAEMVEAATGVNLWREWARIEVTGGEGPYQLPPRRCEYGGVIASLARQEYPDMSVFQDPEIVYRLHKRHHAGLVVTSRECNRVKDLLGGYSRRFAEDFLATMPPLDERPEEA
ncbi:MAG: ATPase [Chloroflexota bacterium]|nr:ATPase [Chloroflexota bacterium]